MILCVTITGAQLKSLTINYSFFGLSHTLNGQLHGTEGDVGSFVAMSQDVEDEVQFLVSCIVLCVGHNSCR